MLRSPAAPLIFSARVRESAKSAAWSAGLYAGVAGVGALLAQHRGASLATQVFAAEWGAGRLGVSWSDPEAPLPRTSDVLARLVNEHFDLRPKGIVQMLDLLRPIYGKSAAYGHFGRDEPEFTWERTDRAGLLRDAAGLKAA